MHFWRYHTDRHWVFDGVHAFYGNALLRAFVFALLSIFVPIFVYQQGLAAYHSIQAGLLSVALFYLIMRITIILVSIPASRIVEKIGFRRSVIVSIFLLITWMVFFLIAKHSLTFVWLGSVALALNVPFYWIARDSALSQDASSSSMGRSMAGIATLEKIAYLAGPFVAGVIITFWGFSVLFALSLILLLVSAIPLLWMPHHTHKNGVSFTGFIEWLQVKHYLHQALASAGAAMEDSGLGIVWPIALFLIGFDAGTLGTVFSLVAIATIATQYIVGIIFDKLHRRWDFSDEIVFIASATVSGLLWIVRLFIFTLPQVLAVDSFGQVFQTVYYGFQSDYSHLGGKRMGSISFWVYMQMVYSITSLFICLVFIAAIFLSVWKPVLFLMITVFVILSAVQAKESNLGRRH